MGIKNLLDRWRRRRAAIRASKDEAHRKRMADLKAQFPDADPLILSHTIHPVLGVRAAAWATLAEQSRRRADELRLRAIIREELDRTR